MMSAGAKHLCAELYTSVVSGRGFNPALTSISDISPDIRLAFQSQCLVRNNYHQINTYNFDKNALEEFNEVSHLNILPKYLMQCPMNKIGQTSRFLTAHQIEKTDFYDAFLKKRDGINRASAIILHREYTDSAIIVAHFPKRFSERDELVFNALLEAIRPQFQNAFSLLLQLNKRKSRSPNADFFLEQIPTIAFVLSAQHRIRFSNARAEKFFDDTGETKIINGGKLELLNRADQACLETIVAKASTTQVPQGPVRLSGTSGRFRMLFAIPMETGNDASSIVVPFIEKKPDILVLLFDPADIPATSTNVLQMGLGLTERESAVVRKLIDGHSLRETSEALGITYNTARNHIAAATDKTGANSQTTVVKMGTQILSRSSSDNVSIEC